MLSWMQEMQGINGLLRHHFKDIKERICARKCLDVFVKKVINESKPVTRQRLRLLIILLTPYQSYKTFLQYAVQETLNKNNESLGENSFNIQALGKIIESLFNNSEFLDEFAEIYRHYISSELENYMLLNGANWKIILHYSTVTTQNQINSQNETLAEKLQNALLSLNIIQISINKGIITEKDIKQLNTTQILNISAAHILTQIELGFPINLAKYISDRSKLDLLNIMEFYEKNVPIEQWLNDKIVSIETLSNFPSEYISALSPKYTLSQLINERLITFEQATLICKDKKSVFFWYDGFLADKFRNKELNFEKLINLTHDELLSLKVSNMEKKYYTQKLINAKPTRH